MRQTGFERILPFLCTPFFWISLLGAPGLPGNRGTLLPFEDRSLQIAAGDVSASTVVFWVRSSTVGTVLVEYGAAFNRQPSSVELTVTATSIPARARVSGLLPGQSYLYRATQGRTRSPLGRFRTPDLPGSYRGLRFGVSGDSRGDLAPFPAIANTAWRNLDFFVNLGDTIYADYPSPAVPAEYAQTTDEFRAKYAEVQSTGGILNAFRRLRKSTSLFSMIDDHEVSNDFSGGASPGTDSRFEHFDTEFTNETPLYEAALQTFHEYNPLDEEFFGETGEPRTALKRRLYRFRTFGSDAAIFLLDARSFRDVSLSPIRNPFSVREILRFTLDSWIPSRTLLGNAQLQQLKEDLLLSRDMGIRWKFIFVPEPIQNLGFVAAQDRFEGYAFERNDLLAFLDREEIPNVVFISADFHGHLVNNLTYQSQALGRQIPMDAFEVITGPVAFDPPLGPLLVDIGLRSGLITQDEFEAYSHLPRPLKERFVQGLLNIQLRLQGYDPLGLDECLDDDCLINAELLQGSYSATHVYGWTEFEIDPLSGLLTVTTFGIEPYSREDLLRNPLKVLLRWPQVASQFQVFPN